MIKTIMKYVEAFLKCKRLGISCETGNSIRILKSFKKICWFWCGYFRSNFWVSIRSSTYRTSQWRYDMYRL